MATKITKPIVAGIIATLLMTIFMMLMPILGAPKMNPALMLSMIMKMPLAVGWIAHFMIGIIFAFAYAAIFINLLKKVQNNLFKGAIFGFTTFIFAQIIMATMGSLIGEMPSMEVNMMLMMISSIVSHIIFGIGIAIFIKK